MSDRSATLESVLAANRYLVLATADEDGRPWATPVFFGRLDAEQLCWVSSPESRHSRNIAARSAIAITVFDSAVAVGQAEAAYFEADAAAAVGDEVAAVLDALNAKLPAAKQLSADDLGPDGRLVAYRAQLRRRFVLVRGGDEELGNVTDRTVEL